MPCTIPQKEIEDTIQFHGHSCPGLSIGIRAAELARREFGRDNPDEDLVCVSETDMCGVDAVQFLTGCTYGKGNYLHRDYGKMAFNFYHRPSGKSFRCMLRPEVRGDLQEELSTLHRKLAAGEGNDQDRERCLELRDQMRGRLMEAELEDLFVISEPREPMPRGASILESLTCEACGEATMESRTRRFAGKTLCLPCFAKVEQKI